MAENDIIVLNSVLEQKKKETASTLPDDDFFELFTFEQLLKNFDLSYEELGFGKTGSEDDGGIDGFFFLINGDLIKEKIDLNDFKRFPTLDLFLIQSKRSNTFSENVFEKVITTVQDIFDLNKDMDKLRHFYNSGIIEKATIFRNSYIDLAVKHPRLKIHFYYASKGDKNEIHPKIHNKAKTLESSILNFFSGCEPPKIKFFGARELLDLSRVEKTYTLKLNFVETYLSKGQDNYLVLSNLVDYYKFVTDEDEKLRRYIFDANVRDFQGWVEVNKDILKTLRTEETLDFWWLNNGITILASNATVAGKTITLDNVQIVNGLQTTECIYQYIESKQREGQKIEEIEKKDKKRSIVVKIIVTKDPDSSDKIIKATNFQTSIPPASLKAKDKIQLDLEDYFKKHDWYYDRRKNYYKNIGKPLDRIISIPFMAQDMMAIALKEPDNARARPSSLIKRDSDYSRVFDENVNPSVYLFCAQTVRKIESFLRKEIQRVTYQEKSNLKFHISMITVMKLTEDKNYNISLIENLSAEDINESLMQKSVVDTVSIARKFMEINPWSLDRVAKSREFVNYLKDNINDSDESDSE